MRQPPSFRAIERALDELRRGFPVRLRAGRGCVDVWAAECMDNEQMPPAARLVLPSRRAAYLELRGAGGDTHAVTMAAEERMLRDVLYGGKAAQGASCTAASEVDSAALALVKLTGFLPVALVAPPSDTDALEVSAEEVRAYLARPVELRMEHSVSLPVEVSEAARVAVFRERGGQTHLALLFGAPEAANAPLVRLHSSCLTGDILGSLRCDCGEQLKEALHALAKAGAGVLLYLNQEGRGIGLANKLHAYRLQEEGLDTVDANLALGFGEDERDFALAGRMLEVLGISKVRLLTNNPAKVEALGRAGIVIAERIPLAIAPGRHNEAYLKAKAQRLGHQY